MAEVEPAPGVLVLAQDPRKSVAAVRRNVGRQNYIVGLLEVGGLDFRARLLLFRFEFFQVNGRVFVEFFPAGFAANFNFLAVVFKSDWLAHLTQLFAGDDAGIEGVRLECRFGCFLGGIFFGGFYSRIGLLNWSGDHCHRKQEEGEGFHGVYWGMVWI